jgi:hypothetical protein
MLLLSMFKTGGRASEALSLTNMNFQFIPVENIVLVKDMRLLKRYLKKGETTDPETNKKRWITERLVNATRNEFPILLGEPLTTELLAWLKDKQSLLSPSPIKHGFPLGRRWAYHLVRELDAKLPDTLREELDLNKPLKNKQGDEVRKRIHLWPHWFRSQRASQLVADYNFQEQDLLEWFTWEDIETSVRYAHKGWTSLANKMKASALYPLQT